jgi:inactivated superfamily I helicase
MRQARAAEPRLQLEAVLQCLLVVVLIGRIFNDNNIVSLADFTPLLSLGLPLLWDLD